MSESPTLKSPNHLKELAINCYNETLLLMQAGKYKEALNELEKAEKAAKEAKTDYFFLYFQTIKGYLMENIGEYEKSLRLHALSLKTSEALLAQDPDNKVCESIYHMNLDAIKPWRPFL